MFVLNDIYLENNWLFFTQFWVCSDPSVFKSECVQNWTLSYLWVFKSEHIQDLSVFKWQQETKQFCRTKHKWDTQHNVYVQVMFVLNRLHLENNRLFFTQFWVCSDLNVSNSECVQNWTLSYLEVFKAEHIQDLSVFRLATGNKAILLYQTQIRHATQHVHTGNVCFERHIPRKQLIVFHPILSVFRSGSELNTHISESVQI